MDFYSGMGANQPGGTNSFRVQKSISGAALQDLHAVQEADSLEALLHALQAHVPNAATQVVATALLRLTGATSGIVFAALVNRLIKWGQWRCLAQRTS